MVILGGVLCLLGFYYLLRPDRGNALTEKLSVSKLDKRLLHEGIRDQPKVATWTARVVGLIFLLIGGLIIFASQQQ